MKLKSLPIIFSIGKWKLSCYLQTTEPGEGEFIHFTSAEILSG